MSESRVRKLLEAVVVAGGMSASGASGLEARASDLEKGATTAMVLENSKFEQIDYPEHAQEDAAKVQEITKRIETFQKEYNMAIGFASLNIQNDLEKNVPHSADSSNVSFERAAELQKDLFSFLAARTYTQAKPDSTESFDQVMAYDMPRFFARYGIFAKPLEVRAYNFKENTVRESAINLQFGRVIGVHADVGELWGEKIPRTVLSLGDLPPDFHALPLSDATRMMSAQTFFQNICVYESVFQNELQNQDSARKEFMSVISTIKDMSLEEIAEQFKGEALSTMLIALAMGDINDRVAKNPITNEQMRARLIAHETSHLLDVRTPSFRRAFPALPGVTARESLRHSTNLTVNEEIGALLTELEYAPNKNDAFDRFYGYLLPQGAKAEFNYHSASKWILDTISAEIINNPEKYPLSFYQKSVLTAEEQVLRNLPSMMDHPAALDSLLHTVRTAHYQTLEKDFSEEYLKSMGVSEPGPSIPWKAIGGGAGIAVALLMARELLKNIRSNREAKK